MSSTIKKNLVRGIFYTAITKYSSIIITIIIGAILARLLTPNDFGIIAIVTVFTVFFNSLTDAGLGMAVVQHKNLNKDDIESIFLFSIIIGTFFSLLFIFLSDYISMFYKIEELSLVCCWLSISIFFFSAQSIPKSIARKKLLFKKISIVTLVIQVISGSFAIILAYNDFSYYSLIYKTILDSFLTFIIFYFINPISFKAKIKKPSLIKVFKFSSFQLSFNFINFFSRNSDNFLIGKFFGSATLGFYDMAYRLMLMPVQNLTHVITPVLLPVLSHIQEDKKQVYDKYLNMVKILAMIGFPISIFFFFNSYEIINLIYGSQWNETVKVFSILSLSVGFQMVLSSAGSIFQVVNRTDLLFLSGSIAAILSVTAIFIGLLVYKDLNVLCYGLLVAFILNFFQGFFLLISKALKQNFWEFLKCFKLPILHAILVYLLNIGLVYIGISFENILLNFVLKLTCFIILLVLVFLFSSEAKSLLVILKRKSV